MRFRFPKSITTPKRCVSRRGRRDREKETAGRLGHAPQFLHCLQIACTWVRDSGFRACPTPPLGSITSPMSSKYGTYETVKARFWPWLSKPFKVSVTGSMGGGGDISLETSTWSPAVEVQRLVTCRLSLTFLSKKGGNTVGVDGIAVAPQPDEEDSRPSCLVLRPPRTLR